jgi:hypothetical protein
MGKRVHDHRAGRVERVVFGTLGKNTEVYIVSNISVGEHYAARKGHRDDYLVPYPNTSASTRERAAYFFLTLNSSPWSEDMRFYPADNEFTKNTLAILRKWAWRGRLGPVLFCINCNTPMIGGVICCEKPLTRPFIRGINGWCATGAYYEGMKEIKKERARKLAIERRLAKKAYEEWKRQRDEAGSNRNRVSGSKFGGEPQLHLDLT